MPIHRFDFGPSDGASKAELLAERGPVISVRIHPPPALERAWVAQGIPLPPPVPGLALVDTGASLCAINESSIRSLGVKPIGRVRSGSAAGVGECNVYPGRIALLVRDGEMTLDHHRLTGVNLDDITLPGIDRPLIALLGRDFLQGFILHYDGPAGNWTLTH
jgi:hypothetical protein